MRAIPFDRFVKYPELTEILESMAESYPDLVTVESLGKSHEDRDIWLVTVTNAATGTHDEKPAVWIDANVHATELTGSAAALYLLDKLVTGYGTDPTVTRAVDTRTFYVVPRISPDGAELAMAERPVWVRSSVRPWPFTEQQDGLVAKDIDGDGRILSMRVPDPNGPWQVSPADHRLLVARDPVEDVGPGPYYRLLIEGDIENYDGTLIPMAQPLHGLDMNRNYPVDWRPEGNQRGAGPYPTSEPEIRAVVDRLANAHNVSTFVQYHTFSGVHLRPSAAMSDDNLPTHDLRVFKKIGEKATEITGYPSVSVFHDFKYDPKDTITGSAHDWVYDHLGILGWTTEFWSPQRQAGITDYKFIEWFLDHPVDDDLKMLAWSDEELGGEGYVDWYPYDHPQLGPIELGGWNTAHCFRNPPPDKLEAEIAPHADWAIWQAMISPRLALRECQVTALGGDSWRVRLVVENAGWLPTNTSDKALERNVVRPLEAEVVAADGIEIVGDRVMKQGQLTGRFGKTSTISFGPPTDATSDRAKFEWTVRAPAGTRLQLVARHQRAGVVRTTVTLA